MPERFRARVFKQAMESAARNFSDVDVTSLFAEILGGDDPGGRDNARGERIVSFLQRLTKGHKRQGLRFLEVCSREDAPKRWTEFLAHEQARADSPWLEKPEPDAKDDVMKRFAKRLHPWWESTDPGSWVNQQLKDAIDAWLQGTTDLPTLEQLLGGFEPTVDEYRTWRLLLLRAVLQKIIRGEKA